MVMMPCYYSGILSITLSSNYPVRLVALIVISLAVPIIHAVGLAIPAVAMGYVPSQGTNGGSHEGTLPCCRIEWN
jgi:hypothetical protein